MSFALTIPKEMREKYLERRARDVDLLGEALAKGELGEFRRIGHQLKGNAPTFGFQLLADIGREMEAAGERGDAQAARNSLQAFRDWLIAEQAQGSA
jgi:HPt (histidine-containing phosphotransfer) domain-containing protein